MKVVVLCCTLMLVCVQMQAEQLEADLTDDRLLQILGKILKEENEQERRKPEGDESKPLHVDDGQEKRTPGGHPAKPPYGNGGASRKNLEGDQAKPLGEETGPNKRQTPGSFVCRSTALGTEYTGTVSTTSGDLTCLPWEGSSYDDPSMFPDATVTDASNYCRNPDNDVNGPWCYTAEGWGYCDIPYCGEVCRSTQLGTEYTGTVSTAINGLTCLPWCGASFDPSDFPDETVDHARIYCRNPDNDVGGPWCYTTEGWGYCDVPYCATPADCKDLVAPGVTSGVYTIYIGPLGEPVDVYCDMDTAGGGWTIFQKRMDGSTDFYRTWDEYENGFGDRNGEFWLGNRYLNTLTSQKPYEMRVDLGDFEGEVRHATYSLFNVGPPSDKYRLSVGGYTGNAGESLIRQNDFQFSTKDQDNDVYQGDNCATIYEGAWWFRDCFQSHLNGRYSAVDQVPYAQGIIWMKWHGYYYSLKTSTMKLRPL